MKQRIRMCEILKSVASTDVKFSKVVQPDDPAREEARLRAAELFGEWI